MQVTRPLGVGAAGGRAPDPYRSVPTGAQATNRSGQASWCRVRFRGCWSELPEPGPPDLARDRFLLLPLPDRTRSSCQEPAGWLSRRARGSALNLANLLLPPARKPTLKTPQAWTRWDVGARTGGETVGRSAGSSSVSSGTIWPVHRRTGPDRHLPRWRALKEAARDRSNCRPRLHAGRKPAARCVTSARTNADRLAARSAGACSARWWPVDHTTSVGHSIRRPAARSDSSLRRYDPDTGPIVLQHCVHSRRVAGRGQEVRVVLRSQHLRRCS